MAHAWKSGENKEEIVSDWLRNTCGIDSRSELGKDDNARKIFRQLETDFMYRNTPQ